MKRLHVLGHMPCLCVAKIATNGIRIELMPPETYLVSDDVNSLRHSSFVLISSTLYSLEMITEMIRMIIWGGIMEALIAMS